MSQSEHPERLARPVTVEDVRHLMGASTPHFALQIRNRIARLIAGLEPGDPARVLGEQELERLETLGFAGETRGHEAEDGMQPLPSVSVAAEHGADPVGGPGAGTPEPRTTPA